jgi:hypothetical protein
MSAITSNKENSPTLTGVKRPGDEVFKVPSPILKKLNTASPENSPPLSIRTGKPLSPETLLWIKDMQKKMDASMTKRPEFKNVEKINALWKKEGPDSEPKKQDIR